MKKNKIIFIVWNNPHKGSPRAHLLSQIGGYNIFYFHSKLPFLKYFINFLNSLDLIKREKPKIVFLQVPPLFILPLVYFFPKVKFVVDAHCGIFEGRWKMFLPFFFGVLKRTLVLIHSPVFAKILNKRKIKTLFLIDPFPINVEEKEFLNSDKDKETNKIVVVFSYSEDEDYERFFEAIAGVSDKIKFYFTGKPPIRLVKKYSNVKNFVFTGYLSEKKFYKLLSTSSFLLSYTNRKYGMLRAAYEGLFFENILILPYNKSLPLIFKKGVVWFKNFEDLKNKLSQIDDIIKDRNSLFEEIKKLKSEIKQEFKMQFGHLMEILDRDNFLF